MPCPELSRTRLSTEQIKLAIWSHGEFVGKIKDYVKQVSVLGE